MVILEYPKCSTCKKAVKYLKEKNLKFEDRNIVLDNPKEEEIKKWIEMSGKDVKEFFNTSGIKYRELKLKEKLKFMSCEEKVKLLSTDGMLVKRPLLIDKDKILIGFKQNEWEKL